MKITFLDIETATTDAVLFPKGALDFNRGKIDLIGYTTSSGIQVFPPSECVDNDFRDLNLVGQNFKFDIKFLRKAGFNIPTSAYYGDTQIMASICLKKIPETWLNEYNEKRKNLNKNLPKGKGHREGKRHSLKTLAPYFLNVESFWEDPSNHNDVTYITKDVEYTQRLYEFFEKQMRTEGTWDFYFNKAMPFARMTLEAEYDGVRLDLVELERVEKEAVAQLQLTDAALEKEFVVEIGCRNNNMQHEINNSYLEKCEVFVTNLKDKTKEPATRARYSKLCEIALQKIEPFNFSSPTQLLWLLRDARGYDVGDWNGTDSTAVDVLQRLKSEGHEDVGLILDYRKYSKRISTYCKPWREMALNERIFFNLNVAGPKTGRLSSSAEKGE